jgi:hypothetical protein
MDCASILPSGAIGFLPLSRRRLINRKLRAFSRKQTVEQAHLSGLPYPLLFTFRKPATRATDFTRVRTLWVVLMEG